MLKKENAKDMVPSLLDEQGSPLTSQEENLNFVHRFYSQIFAGEPLRNMDTTNARAKISLCWKATVLTYLKNQLDASISEKDICESIIISLQMAKPMAWMLLYLRRRYVKVLISLQMAKPIKNCWPLTCWLYGRNL